MTLKWKWLVSYVLVILLLMMAIPAVTQADDTDVNGVLPLAVSGAAVSGITGSGATITWTTNGNATSQVFYDTVTHTTLAGYPNHTALDNIPVSNHSQPITGLTANITYYFRVESKATLDGTAYDIVSDENTFVTTGVLNITAVAAGSITSSAAVISWTTNNTATSQVFYDTVTRSNTADYTYAHPTTPDTTLVTSHSQSLGGLTGNTTYYYRVRSTATISGSDFISVSDEYTFKTATSGGGGGGGGGGVPGSVTVAGVTNITKVVSATGVFSQSIYAWSDDNQVLVYAAAGTTSLNADGTPLGQISLIHMTAPPAFQAGAGMITLTYDFTPASATFNPPATVRFSYDPALIPAGVAETGLQIAYYDNTRSAWVTLTSTVDTTNHFVFAQISHFTPYAVTYGVKAAPPVPTTTTTPTSTTTTTPTSTTTTTMTSTTPTPATFNISNLTISPENVNPGQTVTISVLAQNTGDVSGTYNVTLKINGVITDRKILNLAAQTKDTVIFTVSQDDIGEYSIDINGLAGKFTVAESPTTTTPAPVKKIPPWAIAVVGSVLFVFVVIAIIIIRLRTGRKTL
jgi:hypothetical protein